MRDPKRIQPLLKLLETLWLKNPDLRLFQLIKWIGGKSDLFYVEDEVVKQIIKQRISDD